MAESKDLTTEEPFPWLDRSSQAARVAGTLVGLITLFTSYSHFDIPAHESIAVNQQIGIPHKSETALLWTKSAGGQRMKPSY